MYNSQIRVNSISISLNTGHILNEERQSAIQVSICVYEYSKTKEIIIDKPLAGQISEYEEHLF